MMNKRVLGFGFLLLLAGIIMAYASVQSIFSNIPNYISSTQTLALQPKSGFFVPISIRNESILQIVYNSTVPINFFLMNSTAKGMLPQSNLTGIGNAAYLQGNGLIYTIYNSTHGMFPYITNISLAQAPNYWYRNQTIIGNGTYYAVFQNYENKSNTVFYTMLNRSVSSLASSEQNYSYGNIALNVFSTLAVIAGIIIMFYALFMKPKAVEEQEGKEVESIYASIGRRPAVRHRKPKKATKKSKGKKRKRA
jgi:hypothetical protein